MWLSGGAYRFCFAASGRERSCILPNLVMFFPRRIFGAITRSLEVGDAGKYSANSFFFFFTYYRLWWTVKLSIVNRELWSRSKPCLLFRLLGVHVYSGPRCYYLRSRLDCLIRRMYPVFFQVIVRNIHYIPGESNKQTIASNQPTNLKLRILPPSHNLATTLQRTSPQSPAPTSLSTSPGAKSPRPTQQPQRAQTPMPRKRPRACSETQKRLGQSPPGGI